MRLAVFALLTVVAVASAGDSEWYMLKKWAMLKAFEGCFGEEVIKQYMVKLRSAIGKCRAQDAPELELPMFRSTYKTAGALVNNAFNPYNRRNNFMMKSQRPSEFEGMFKQYLMQKAFKELMEDSDDDMDYSKYSSSSRPNRVPVMPLMGGGRFRQRRETEDPDSQKLDLGQRLKDRIEDLHQQLQYELGNYTCVLRECGVLDSSNEFAEVDRLVEEFERFPVEDQWLNENVERDIRLCHATAEAVPQEVLNECYLGPELAKVRTYKRCLKKRKLRTCLFHDMRQQLEENFAPVDNLVEQTDMQEKSLLPLVYKLLHGDTQEEPRF